MKKAINILLVLFICLVSLSLIYYNTLYVSSLPTVYVTNAKVEIFSQDMFFNMKIIKHKDDIYMASISLDFLDYRIYKNDRVEILLDNLEITGIVSSIETVDEKTNIFVFSSSSILEIGDTIYVYHKNSGATYQNVFSEKSLSKDDKKNVSYIYIIEREKISFGYGYFLKKVYINNFGNYKGKIIPHSLKMDPSCCDGKRRRYKPSSIF